ncbi:hypothetical protein COLO4_27373 [Corchorus olitorius]|uniref:Pentacotripeptide-repeat region of PRORP domain-containing protein n=1 Tax=Corchorus olitorius TaxID=93759 RepID=A0A1R3HRM7_9ROSI|nr:hypothetical protein COLO4_27373 [Corchorus olitorius]
MSQPASPKNPPAAPAAFLLPPPSMNGSPTITTVRAPTMRNPTLIIVPGQSFHFLSFLAKSFSSVPSSLHLEPEPLDNDLPLLLHSILSKPNWKNHPSLPKLTPSISSSHVYSVFSLNPHLLPKTALDFSYWISQKPHFKHSVFSYSALINILVTNKFFGPAEKIRDLMIRSSSSIQETRFVLEFLASMNRSDQLGSAFKLNLRAYNHLLMSFAKFSMIDELKSLYCEMLKNMVSPNIFTLNAMVHAYCKIGNVAEAQLYVRRMEEAEDVMIRMKEEGIFPDSFTYTLLLDAYGCLGSMHSAFDVLKRMFDAGCEPSSNTYSFLIKHLSKKQREKDDRQMVQLELNAIVVNHADVWKTMEFDTALELFEKMRENGCVPNVNTYSKLIIGLSKVGRFHVAQRLFDHMREEGISPTGDIYNSLFSCCCELRLYDNALIVVDSMISSGQLPYLESYKQLICGLYDEGDKEKANTVFNS